MKIFAASDHAGFQLKAFLIKNLPHDVVDLGTDSEKLCDYPVFAKKLVHSILEAKNASLHEDVFGILVCGTGIGMSIAANRHRLIRAALCVDEEMAIIARKHNDANVIVFGARIINQETALACVNAFISTKFDGGRHARRVNMIDDGGQNGI